MAFLLQRFQMKFNRTDAVKKTRGLPSGTTDNCQRRGHGFDPWYRKMPYTAEQ